jgi:hypothetical protein
VVAGFVSEEHKQRRRAAFERAAKAHERAAGVHEDAVSFWVEHGNDVLAARHRRDASQQLVLARDDWDRAAGQ